MKKLILASVLTICSSITFANENSGCGLGAQVMVEQDSTIKQALAVSTNHSTGSQTFGITSGTSGCREPERFVSNETLNMFVVANMDALATDIANGHGESIHTLAALMDVQDKAAFAYQLQTHFDQIYTTETVSSADVIDRIAHIAGIAG